MLAVATSIVRAAHAASAWRWRGIGADEQRAQTLGVNTRLIKIAGFALTAAFAGAVGAAMSVRWTYIDPTTVFNPFIGFQTVLIALIGGAATLWGPLIAAIVFSLLAETLRLQLPQLYMMTLGLLLILWCCTCRAAWPRCAGRPSGTGGATAATSWKRKRYEWSGDKARDKQREKERRVVLERPRRCSKRATSRCASAA